MRISREVKTAILVIASFILIIFLFNYLKGQNLLDSSRKIYVIYDNVEGLGLSSPVTLNGYGIGKVQEIDFTNGGRKVKVTLLIEDNLEFSINSTALLYDTGLIGGKGVQIIPVFDEDRNVESGDELKGSMKLGLIDMFGKSLSPLEKKLGMILVNADSLLINMNEVFDNTTKNNIKKGIAEFSQAIASFKDASTSVNELIELNKSKLNNTLTNVEDVSANLSMVSDSIASINFTKAIKDLEIMIGKVNGVLSNISQGEGSIGKLLNDEGLYDNLEGATKQMEELLQDMKLNPKRYVHFSLFGKKAKRYDANGNLIKEDRN